MYLRPDIVALSVTVMTTSTINALTELNQRSTETSHAEALRRDFWKVLEVFVAANYPQGIKGSTLMCSIHDAFPSHHSCIACNLNEYTKLIERFLLQVGNISDTQFALTTFLLLLYLATERIQVYLELAELPDSYCSQHFGIIQEIRHWANFIKHPKSFMLVVHPLWEYEGTTWDSAWKSTTERVIIDTAFVKQYYRHDANNNKLDKILARKNDVVVMFPNPVELMTRFVEVQQKLISLINNNQFVRDMLESQTKQRHYFASTQAQNGSKTPTE